MTFLGDFRDFGSGVGLSAPIDAERFRDVAAGIAPVRDVLCLGLCRVLIIYRGKLTSVTLRPAEDSGDQPKHKSVQESEPVPKGDPGAPIAAPEIETLHF